MALLSLVFAQLAGVAGHFRIFDSGFAFTRSFPEIRGTRRP